MSKANLLAGKKRSFHQTLRQPVEQKSTSKTLRQPKMQKLTLSVKMKTAIVENPESKYKDMTNPIMILRSIKLL